MAGFFDIPDYKPIHKLIKRNGKYRIINGVVYKTTNNINGKIYIGKSCMNNFKYLGSGKYINYALNKYGKKNFTKIIIDIANSTQELNEKEKFWIKFYESRNPDIGYNLTKGGDGVGSGEEHPFYGTHFSEEHRKNLSISRIGFRHTKETKQLMSLTRMGENNNFYGKHHSEKTKIILSTINRRENHHRYGKLHTKETKDKMSIAQKGENHPMYGKHPTEETKQKLSVFQKERFKNKENHPNYGKTTTEEIKNKISISVKDSWKKRKGLK